MASDEGQSRLDIAAFELMKEPSASLQFLISSGSDETPGSAARNFGTIRAYLLYRKVDPNRIISTYCRAKPKRSYEIWLVPKGAPRKTCEPEVFSFDKTTLFGLASYPDRYIGSCCIMDSMQVPGVREALKKFANVLKVTPGAKGYMLIYGGTNVTGMGTRREHMAGPAH